MNKPPPGTYPTEPAATAAAEQKLTAQPAPTPDPNPAPVLVFDGGCPFCRHFAAVSELRSGIAGLTIVDGRADRPLRQSLAARGYHLRDGAMVLVGDRVLHGAGAVAWLCAQMQPSPGLLQLLAAVLADPARSRATYPLLLAARRFALGLKRLPIDPDLS
jgi:predicted DCC family thiol-disulfide oxidoreductase YuxK